MLVKKNFILIILGFFIFFVLFAALIIEHVFHYESCKLCIYQRIPYVLSLILIILIFFTNNYHKFILLILSLIFLLSTILAFYHFGIEQGFFEEMSACVVQDENKTLSKADLVEQLGTNNISCKDVNFRFMGLSLATINAILSSILSVIFLRLFYNYEKN